MDHPVSDPLSDIRHALAGIFPGSAAITIGVIDGLPDLTHPALKDSSIEIVSAMVPGGSAAPDPHGTRVCSVIFGTSEQSPGIAPGCSGLILPIFFGGHWQGRPRPASQLDLARAITFALESKVPIINVSAGQRAHIPEPDAHLEQALQRCADDSALIVAAAGNDGCACLHLPAGVPSVLAVGAHTAERLPLDASNWGASYRQNGILAPGENLAVAKAGGGLEFATGTSFATAVVSGVAGLLLSAASRERYRLSARDIGEILIETADPCASGDQASDRCLAGILNPAAALAMLHRIGRNKTTQSVSADGAQPSIVPSLNPGEDSSVMNDIHASGADPAAAKAVMQSACGCQTKPDEDTERPAVEQNEAFTLRLQAQAVQPASSPAARVIQQACGCGGGQPPQLVYAIGALWFDFGTEARHDLFVQQLDDPVRANNPAELFAFLREHPQFAAGLTFILMQEQVPLYAIQPGGPFALQAYAAILDALSSSLDDGGSEQRVSIPGLISGSTRLLNGMTVPVVVPDLRGMYKWRSEDLIRATHEGVAADAQASDEQLLNFLNRVYYELRNLGVGPKERAINFAATNAYQARQTFVDAVRRSFALDSIKVVKSPICRPDSDCWDVELVMFDEADDRRANRIYRYTVDVSDVIPVSVGPVRSWASRA